LEGDAQEVEEVIGVIAQPGESFSLDDLIRQAKEEKGVRPSGGPAGVVAEQAPQETSPRPRTEKREIRISPLARRIAEEKGASLEGITGTGPGGSITKEDVLKAFEMKAKTSLQIFPLLVAKRVPLKARSWALESSIGR